MSALYVGILIDSDRRLSRQILDKDAITDEARAIREFILVGKRVQHFGQDRNQTSCGTCLDSSRIHDVLGQSITTCPQLSLPYLYSIAPTHAGPS